MRKVVVYELSSLDGVAESPDAFISDWDDAMQANLEAVISTQDTVLLGRLSFEEWARYWPTVEDDAFATFINAVQKYVVTSAPLEPQWAHATASDIGLVELVERLKSQQGGDIGVHASISVVQSLLAHDLVDELSLVVAPRIAGQGRRLLDTVPPARLELDSCETSPTGHLLARYRILHH